jgi:hypothetical protein
MNPFADLLTLELAKENVEANVETIESCLLVGVFSDGTPQLDSFNQIFELMPIFPLASPSVEFPEGDEVWLCLGEFLNQPLQIGAIEILRGVAIINVDTLASGFPLLKFAV